jgi:hypothetical protein
VSGWRDDQPTMPARVSVYSLARRVREETQIAMELSIDGPKCDVSRALDHLDRARALLGQIRDNAA